MCVCVQAIFPTTLRDVNVTFYISNLIHEGRFYAKNNHYSIVSFFFFYQGDTRLIIFLPITNWIHNRYIMDFDSYFE